ncbi:MAG: hypothetical protein K2X61_08900 [Caulobacteraceae bacterium]|nr:hypothetical protein [Caulobacteraceae bacterium]
MTDFIDMPVGTRRTWLLWAREHDWGVNAVMTDDGQMVGLVDHWTERCRRTGRVLALSAPAPAFSNPAELRAWAGY